MGSNKESIFWLPDVAKLDFRGESGAGDRQHRIRGTGPWGRLSHGSDVTSYQLRVIQLGWLGKVTPWNP